MIKNKKNIFALTIIAVLTFCFISMPIGKADTTITDGSFNLSFLSGEAFNYQDLANAVTFTFTDSSGDLEATATLTTSDAGGTLTLTPSTTATLTVTATTTNYTLYLNGAKNVGNAIHLSSSGTFAITWNYIGAAIDHVRTLNFSPFWQYLMSGNILAFFQAIYLSAFGLPDILYGSITMLFLVPIYLRTKSLWLLCVLWILLGGFAITLIPAASPIAIIFLILGISGVFWRLVSKN